MTTIRDSVNQIVQTISGWEGITTAVHRFGGVEFNLGKIEIGHIHAHGMVDIPFTRKLRAALVAGGEAELHHLLRDSGWITFYIRDSSDVQQALRLYRLSYLHKHYRRPSDRGSSYQAELAALGFSEQVTRVLYTTAEEDATAE